MTGRELNPLSLGLLPSASAVWLPASSECGPPPEASKRCRVENRVGSEPTNSGLKVRGLDQLGDRFTHTAAPTLASRDARRQRPAEQINQLQE